MPKNNRKNIEQGAGAAGFLPSERQEQQTDKPVQQDTSKPVEQESINVEFIKVTYYISPDDDLKLEQIRLARRRRGNRIDKSALIREAIHLLQE